MFSGKQLNRIKQVLLCTTREAIVLIARFGQKNLPAIHLFPVNLIELMRYRGLKHTPLAHLSRGVAGVVKGVLVVNLPGSPKAVRQNIEALSPLLKPILESLFGDGCSHGG